jgi:hypothetical protein
MARSVADTVAKWKQNAGAAQERYSQGVQGTTVDVMGRAVAAAPVAAARFAQVVSSGAYARAVTESGGTANWKAMTTAKAGHYGTGIAEGGDKFQRAMSKLLPDIESITASLPPRVPGNVGANLQRVAAIANALHSRKGSYKG